MDDALIENDDLCPERHRFDLVVCDVDDRRAEASGEVARELERRWEAALAEVERLEQDHERMRRTELRPLEPAEMADVRRLAADLPALWHADTTLPADRKRLLRLVIAAVTVQELIQAKAGAGGHGWLARMR